MLHLPCEFYVSDDTVTFDGIGKVYPLKREAGENGRFLRFVGMGQTVPFGEEIRLQQRRNRRERARQKGPASPRRHNRYKATDRRRLTTKEKIAGDRWATLMRAANNQARRRFLSRNWVAGLAAKSGWRPLAAGQLGDGQRLEQQIDRVGDAFSHGVRDRFKLLAHQGPGTIITQANFVGLIPGHVGLAT